MWSRNKEVSPAERVNEAAETDPAEAREKAREAKEASKRSKKSISPEERVEEAKTKDPAETRRKARKVEEESKRTKDAITPEERVEKNDSPVRESPETGTPEEARQAEEVGPHKPSHRDTQKEASMQGLPGFGGEMPGEDE